MDFKKKIRPVGQPAEFGAITFYSSTEDPDDEQFRSVAYCLEDQHILRKDDAEI